MHLTKEKNLVLNLKKLVIKLKKYGIQNVCLSGLALTTRVHLLLLNQISKCILDICKGHNISFVNNVNIIRSDMYQEGYHLLRSGKSLLSNNFIENNNYVLKVQTHHPDTSIHVPSV